MVASKFFVGSTNTVHWHMGQTGHPFLAERTLRWLPAARFMIIHCIYGEDNRYELYQRYHNRFLAKESDPLRT